MGINIVLKTIKFNRFPPPPPPPPPPHIIVRAALKDRIRNPETETETKTEYGIRNQISMREN